MKKYDVIIVGAGVGGIVCGLYLVKAGRKVLIVEKNSEPGGYCTSFSRKGYNFDSAVHYLKGCAPDFTLGRIFSDFGLENKMPVVRINPSDTIITPEFEFSVFNNFQETKEQLLSLFPRERDGIDDFFKLMTDTNIFQILAHANNKSFDDLLSNYFLDKKLKAIFDIHLGNLGLPSKKVSAVSATVFYRELLLDSGYYPVGGVQTFVNTLVTKFCELGGEIKTSTFVSRLLVSNKAVKGVLFDTEESLECENVIANCDVTFLFNELLEKKDFEKERNYVSKLVPSISAFVVYIGLKKKVNKKLRGKGSIWHYPSFNIEEYYKRIYQRKLFQKDGYVIIDFPSFYDENMAPPGCDSIILFIGAPYADKKFWDNNREKLQAEVIRRASETIQELKNNIEISFNATPLTLEKYTLNSRGAMYGWESSVAQIKSTRISKISSLKNLFFVGHWMGKGVGHGGVSMVAYSGVAVAKQILRKKT